MPHRSAPPLATPHSSTVPMPLSQQEVEAVASAVASQVVATLQPRLNDLSSRLASLEASFRAARTRDSPSPLTRGVSSVVARVVHVVPRPDNLSQARWAGVTGLASERSDKQQSVRFAAVTEDGHLAAFLFSPSDSVTRVLSHRQCVDANSATVTAIASSAAPQTADVLVASSQGSWRVPTDPARAKEITCDLDALSCASEASFIVLGGRSRAVMLVLHDHDRTHVIPVHQHINYVWCVSALPLLHDAGSVLVASGGGDDVIRVSRVSTKPDLYGQETVTTLFCLEGHTRSIRCLAAYHSSNTAGACLASGSMDNQLRIWSLQHGTCTAVLSGHTKGVRCLCRITCRSARVLLVSGSDDCSVRVWDPACSSAALAIAAVLPEPVVSLACVSDAADDVFVLACCTESSDIHLVSLTVT